MILSNFCHFSRFSQNQQDHRCPKFKSPIAQKRHHKSRSITRSIVLIGLLLVLPNKGMAQGNSPPTASPAPETVPADRLFFADIVVRGQTVFQVGSLSNLSASELVSREPKATR